LQYWQDTYKYYLCHYVQQQFVHIFINSTVQETCPSTYYGVKNTQLIVMKLKYLEQHQDRDVLVQAPQFHEIFHHEVVSLMAEDYAC